ncbi:hypothetical protein ACQEVF_32685 [Nonomuraea polychroma]|uniref:hypothetical protein n=1 Tax=Nonomuraea polychroma TaxID=46176 RepID=UPI003D900F01
MTSILARTPGSPHRRLPTVPVDATAIEACHLIQTDEQLVRVRDKYKSGPGRLVFVWVAAGPLDDGLPRIGTLEVTEGDTVQCVRVSDWLDSLEREAATS